MHDFKYSDLLASCQHHTQTPPALQNPFLEEPFTNYLGSCKRIDDLCYSPLRIAASTAVNEIISINATLAVNGHKRVGFDEFAPFAPKDELLNETNRQLAEFNAKPVPEKYRIMNALGRQHVDTDLAWDENVQSGMSAIYASVIMLSWAAFETFAADLWAAAINKGPKAIANKVAASNELKRLLEPVSIALLMDTEYDVRENLGSFLRDNRKVSFLRLDELIKTYEIAFGVNGKKLFNTTSGGYIKALAEFRNIFTHKAGIADKDFCKGVGKFSEYNAIQPKEKIVLDGAMVRKLRDAGFDMGFALLNFVDNAIK